MHRSSETIGAIAAALAKAQAEQARADPFNLSIFVPAARARRFL